jgi:hypothetical protein
MIRRLPTLLVASALLAAAPAVRAQALAEIRCAPGVGTFSIRYLDGSDEGQFPVPGFPARCRIGNDSFRIDGRRGPYGMRACGARPVFSLTGTHNGVRFLDGVAFGDNCFMEPAISRLSIEMRPRPRLSLCVVAEPGAAERCTKLPLPRKRQDAVTTARIAALADKRD